MIEIEWSYVSIKTAELTSFVKFTGEILFKETLRRRDWAFRKLEIQTS